MAPEKSTRTEGTKVTENIKLWGIVQGVGFRPFVAKTASELDMKGNVLNIGGLVEITVTDTPKRISAFLHELNENKPKPAEIVHIKRQVIDYTPFDNFTIIKSDTGGDDAAMIPADLAICDSCLNELYDKSNPRYHHPFISCMVCGPRYTIIDTIPYDRENTTMDKFPMCNFCSDEYTNISDRRYHAQTISCHDCGPQLLLKSDTTKNLDKLEKTDDEILDTAAEILKNSGVILFKSVGGYNLVASPFDNKAVAKLRQIKNREEKPFAVMFRSLDEIKEYCNVNPVEEKLLSSSARPIILLEHLPSNYNEINKSRFIGSFLPSFAAQYLLLDRISPLIFTSANLSDMPMIKDDDDAFRLFEEYDDIDAIIYNEREILIHADDSVARVIDDQPQMIRRSKGYAPVPLFIHIDSDAQDSDNMNILQNQTQIFAAGGQLKNSFALSKGGFTYMSQYFGDMDTVENQALYDKNLNKLMKFFRIKPNVIVCDLHPLYFTSQYARNYAKAHNLPLIEVQHHHAHIASVMAENDLNEPVIGICFDGTGYGTDGKIWGGEFLLCEGATFKRIAHLRYVDMIGGDSSIKDAMRSAISYLYAYESKDASFENEFALTDMPDGDIADIHCGDIIDIDISDIIAFGKSNITSSPNFALVNAALKNNINTVQSSSMGRLFDAVSALLGIKSYNDYEGQCAIMLEDAAAYAQNHPGENIVCDFALSFHNRIIDMILEQSIKARKEYDTNLVALTGGTFQNRILMEGTLKKLRDNGFKPYYNISVSPNDGGIALGQTYIAMHNKDLI